MRHILINEISLENFRVFKEKSNFELAPITILTGANSSGKSSIIKALNLMHVFYKNRDKDDTFLNFKENHESSYHHQLGDFEFALNRENPGKKEFTITYKIPYNETYNNWGDLFVENTFCIDENSHLKNGKLKTSSIYVEENGEKILLGNNREETKKSLESLVYNQIQLFHQQSDFIESVRANTQRLYTFTSQGTSFNRFLVKFLDKKHATKFIAKWIKEFEIGDDVDYQSNLLAGVGTQLNIIRGNDKINIVDLGYGVTQFLALLLRIVYIGEKADENRTTDENYYTTIAIEEPETNLHPKYQSKLADLLLDAHKTFGICFIIETHSEYLIRKLQYLTAKGDIKPEETVIHYIGNPDASKREPDEEQVRTIHIKPSGQLTKPFGSGFYDEADNLALALLDYSIN
jgi:predicted ATPase